MQLIKAIKTSTKVNGLSKPVIVSIEVEHEDLEPNDYWDADLYAETVKGLESGRLECYWVKVTARFVDLAHYEGFDSLGQVIVKDRKDLLTLVADHGMRQNAVADLVEQVLNGSKELDKFLGKAA